MTGVDAGLVVTHVISGDLWAGAEVQVFNLCRALQASETVQPTAVVFNEGILYDKLEELGIPVTLADESRNGPVAIARSIAFHCKKHGSAIVHTHGFKENVLGIMGKELARVPFSLRTVHGNPETKFSIKQPHKWLVNRFDVWLGRSRQQAVIAVSSQLAATLENTFPGKVHKIFNFVDVDDIRSKWPLADNTNNSAYRIGIVGRLAPVKRVDLFIQTIALLNQKGIACNGVVIGAGPMEDELRKLADDLNISDHVEFKGFVNPSLDELRKLDLLLMTSDHEGLPMTLLEALCLRIPIVAHEVGGIPEVLENGNCGWLVADHTREGYYNSVLSVLACQKSRKAKVDSGLAHVKHRFGLSSNAAAYLSLYNEITTFSH